MRRALVAAMLSVGLMGSGVAVAPRALAAKPVTGAQEPPVREPIIGACIRHVIWKLLNLPGLDVFDMPIPEEPMALVIGGQFSDCHP